MATIVVRSVVIDAGVIIVVVIVIVVVFAPGPRRGTTMQPSCVLKS